MKKKNIYAVLLWITISSSFQAQTTNKGIIAVQGNTILSTKADFVNKPQGIFMNDGQTYIFKNFTNDGVVTHSGQSEGWTRFEGTHAQVIDGNMESEFKNILFYNSSSSPAFLLGGSVKVNGLSAFNQGIINNRDFGGSFLFSENAEHVDAWNGSFVDGKVDKAGQETFIFPVGNKEFYRYCGISAPSDTDSKFEATYYFHNSNEIRNHDDREDSIEMIDDQEYWIVEKTGGYPNVILTLSWDQSTTPSEIYNGGTEDLIIVGYDESVNKWINLGGIVDLASQTVSTPIDVMHYGYFTLARSFKQLEDCVEIYNVITPLTKDGINDFFYIACLENFPENTVEIFNRWGVRVFKTSQYGSNGNVFEGYSEGRATVDGSGTLPTGTYFYILNYNARQGTKVITHKKVGYLYLNAE